MKMRTTLLYAGLALVALLALAAVGSLAGGGDASPGGLLTVDEPGAGEGGDDVMASIDAALGRLETNGLRSAAGGTANAAPPVADAKTAARESAAAGAGSVSPSAAPAQTAPGDPGLTMLQDERKIVQTASLKLQVEDVGGGFEAVGRAAAAAGGFVASSSFALQGETQVASVTIRVPVERYQAVLAELRGLAKKVDIESSNASDVTAEYSDHAARLRTLEATESQYLTLLGQAKSINEVLQVQDRLNSVRGQIEQVKGRMALLDRLGNLATITVQLRPEVVPAKAPSDAPNLGATVSEAWAASIEFLGGIAAGVLRVVVFGWWVPLIGAPAYVLLRRKAAAGSLAAHD